MNYLITIIFLILLTFQISNNPNIKIKNKGENLAFPGAEGFGKYTTGGRRGLVFIVTNLNDSGIGSLRWALEAREPRTVVFEISGNIKLKSAITIRNGNLSIAGQTAPGDGITIQDYPIKIIDSDNIIIRFIRFRLGDLSKKENDAFEARRGRNLIIDHCSFSWGTDETSSVYDFENTTIQFCIIAESLNNSVHEKGNHGFGSIWGGKNVSFFKNLMTHFVIRVPSISTNSNIADIRNNVVFNWSSRATNNGALAKANLYFNYYKPGPATLAASSLDVARHFLFPSANNNEYPEGLGKFYLEGNILEGRDLSSNQWLGVRLPSSNLTRDYLEHCKNKDKRGKLIPFPIPFGTYSKTLNAEEAFEEVLTHSGASFFRDKIDHRLVEEVRTGKINFKGTKTGLLGIIDSQDDVGGWPILNSLPAPIDTDRDGMPDKWEIENGLNPERRDDRFFDLDPNITNLEVYLNSLVEHIIK